MKALYSTFLLLINLSMSYGQTDRLTLLLQEVIDVVENDCEVRYQTLEIQKKKIELQIAKEKWLPRISADYSIRYNTQLQSTILPDNFGGSTDNRVTFGTTNNTSLSLNLNQSIFDSNKMLEIRIAEMNLNRAQLNLEEIKLNRQVDILKDLVDYIYYAELNLLYQNALQENDSLINLAEARWNNGVISELEYIKIKVKYSNQNQRIQEVKEEYSNIRNFTSNKYLDFDFLEIEVKLSDLNFNDLFDDKMVRLEQGKLELSKQTTQARKKEASKIFNPTISLNANYTTQYQDNTFNYLNGSWTPFNYVGLTVQMPLFNGMENTRKKEYYKVEELQNQVSDNNYLVSIERSKFSWDRKLNSLLSDLKENEDNLRLAEFVYNQEFQRVQNGTSSLYSFLEASFEKVTSQSNVLNNLYELQKHQLEILTVYSN